MSNIIILLHILQAGVERVQRTLMANYRGTHSRYSGPKLSGVGGSAISSGPFHGYSALPPGHNSPAGSLPAAIPGCCPSSWSSSGGVNRGVLRGFNRGAINGAMGRREVSSRMSLMWSSGGPSGAIRVVISRVIRGFLADISGLAGGD